jgi:hypothetical protein
MCPYQRLAPCLATDRPWLGVGMVRQPLPYDSFLRCTSVVYPGASPRSTSAPEPGSRRLYAGCRLGRKQVPPRLVPSRSAFPVSASLESLSTRLQRFACARLPGSHLTLSRSAVSATFTTPAMVPAQLAVVWNLRLRGGSEGPALIANAALLRVALSTWDYPPHSWHNRALDIRLKRARLKWCVSDENPRQRSAYGTWPPREVV